MASHTHTHTSSRTCNNTATDVLLKTRCHLSVTFLNLLQSISPSDHTTLHRQQLQTTKNDTLPPSSRSAPCSNLHSDAEVASSGSVSLGDMSEPRDLFSHYASMATAERKLLGAGAMSISYMNVSPHLHYVFCKIFTVHQQVNVPRTCSCSRSM